MTSSHSLKIAVIGMAGRFPSAKNIEEFYQLLKSGEEGLSVYSVEELKQAGIPDHLLAHPHYIKKGGIVDRKAIFDAPLFGYSAREAGLLNPQNGVLHECVWDALENAGYSSDKYSGLIGLYLGNSPSPDNNLSNTAPVSTRIAYQLNLTGPAFDVQTTCSTSLVAIHLACQGLILGESDIAVAGGVSSLSLDKSGYLYEEGMILSADGACRTFDAEASGTVFSEGCGLLVLKRLEDAWQDQDNVLAIISGSAINNDGHRKAAYTAPSVDGQIAAIKAAQHRAGISSSSITYVEAHGTGTKLGDPVEIEALKEVFDLSENQSCKIGSVKSTIGHLGIAAGVAGMIKTILSLQYKQLFPSLHFKTPNPHIDFKHSPFCVNTTLCDWTADNDAPRRAGVSSFGIGGTNAHVIVEESVQVAETSASRKYNMIFISGNSENALVTIRENLLCHVKKAIDISVADLCYTLHLGRKDLPYRGAVVIKDREELITKLGTFPDNNFFSGKMVLPHRKVCFLFPGQGSQYLNMGRELYEQEAIFRQLIDDSFSIANNISGVDYKQYLFPCEISTELENNLHQTAITQPLLFIFEYALAKLLMHWGCQPDALMGHSIGEYVAACLSGVFSLKDALTIVIQRGKLMQSLPPGSMLSVLMTEKDIRPLLSRQLCVAAINSPNRVVISGDTQAITALKDALDQQQIPNSLLRTSHAFHSHHMEPVLAEYQRQLEKITFSVPQIPFVSNISGRWIETAQAISPAYWSQQLFHTVQFSQGVSFLSKQYKQVFVEVGPGKSLNAFVLQTLGSMDEHVSISLIRDHRDAVPDQNYLFSGLCQLFVSGSRFDWDAFYREEKRGRIPLPTYPFEGKCYYTRNASSSGNGGTSYTLDQARTNLTDLPKGQPIDTCRLENHEASHLSTEHIKDTRSELLGQYIAPNTSVEEALAAILARFLGVDKIGIQDNFFDLGIDSLLSIRVITEIRQHFDIDISLESLFENPSVHQQAKLISQSLGKDQIKLPPLVTTNHNKIGPLSSSQKRLWMISQLEESFSAYNTGVILAIDKPCIPSLKKAFDTIITRHSILRTVYSVKEGQPIQTILDEYELPVSTFDISHYDEKEREINFNTLWETEVVRPFNIKNELMLRVLLVKFSQSQYRIMVIQHHITTDVWSGIILFGELEQLYAAYANGKDNPLSPLKAQYIDYAQWQYRWLQSDTLNEQLRYWKESLRGIPQVHNLPLDRPRPRQQSHKGGHVSSNINNDIFNKLTAICRQQKVTLFMLLQAAYAVLLSRYSGESDIVVGFPAANRFHKEVEPLIGFFVNTLVLRSNLSNDPLFFDFLNKTKSNLISSYKNQHIPFEILVDELNPDRSLSYDPVVQIQLAMVNHNTNEIENLPKKNVFDKNFSYMSNQAPYSKNDLALFVGETQEGLIFSWEYASDIFDESSIKRIAKNFCVLLHSIIENPIQRVSHLTIISNNDIDKQLHQWNSSQ